MCDSTERNANNLNISELHIFLIDFKKAEVVCLSCMLFICTSPHNSRTVRLLNQSFCNLCIMYVTCLRVMSLSKLFR